MNDQLQSAPEKRNNWILPVGIGCVVILCLCGAAAAGIFLLQDRLTGLFSDTGIEEIVPTEFFEMIEETAVTPMVEATGIPEVTQAPMEDDSMPSDGQYQDEFTLIDDFSSNTFGWIEYEDEITILKFENGAYSFQVLEPTYYDWSYVPVDFSPTFITFDVYGLPGDQDGTFGLFCQYQDETNYYYVEIDLQTKEYVIAQILDDEYIVLNEPLAEDYDWLTTTALKDTPEEPNTITVECTSDNISLIINDELVNSVFVQDPFNSPGEMAFFVFAYEFAGPEGYKVYFDNVTVQ
ncbi:MAG: hypothetical protein P8046_12770 [Anaerolineales bacterium]